MMIPRAIQVQTEVYTRLVAALAPIKVTTTPSGSMQYVRIEGFSATNDEIYKDAESSTHRFSVNAFDAPEGGTRSLAWVWNTLAATNAALNGQEVAGAKLVAEDTQAWFDPKTAEGVFNAQGFIRYRVQLGA